MTVTNRAAPPPPPPPPPPKPVDKPDVRAKQDATRTSTDKVETKEAEVKQAEVKQTETQRVQDPQRVPASAETVAANRTRAVGQEAETKNARLQPDAAKKPIVPARAGLVPAGGPDAKPEVKPDATPEAHVEGGPEVKATADVPGVKTPREVPAGLKKDPPAYVKSETDRIAKLEGDARTRATDKLAGDVKTAIQRGVVPHDKRTEFVKTVGEVGAKLGAPEKMAKALVEGRDGIETPERMDKMSWNRAMVLGTREAVASTGDTKFGAALASEAAKSAPAHGRAVAQAVTAGVKDLASAVDASGAKVAWAEDRWRAAAGKLGNADPSKIAAARTDWEQRHKATLSTHNNNVQKLAHAMKGLEKLPANDKVAGELAAARAPIQERIGQLSTTKAGRAAIADQLERQAKNEPSALDGLAKNVGKDKAVAAGLARSAADRAGEYIGKSDGPGADRVLDGLAKNHTTFGLSKDKMASATAGLKEMARKDTALSGAEKLKAALDGSASSGDLKALGLSMTTADLAKRDSPAADVKDIVDKTAKVLGNVAEYGPKLITNLSDGLKKGAAQVKGYADKVGKVLGAFNLASAIKDGRWADAAAAAAGPLADTMKLLGKQLGSKVLTKLAGPVGWASTVYDVGKALHEIGRKDAEENKITQKYLQSEGFSKDAASEIARGAAVGRQSKGGPTAGAPDLRGIDSIAKNLGMTRAQLMQHWQGLPAEKMHALGVRLGRMRMEDGKPVETQSPSLRQRFGSSVEETVRAMRRDGLIP